MRDSETFIYGLLFLAIVGFQVFKQFLAARAEQRRRQEAQARAAASGQQMPQEEPEPLELTESDWGRPPDPTPPPAARPREVQLVLKPEPVRQRQAPSGGSDRLVAAWQPARARHHLFHSRRALRHGIVMMTVLGPCRAVQPYDNNNSNNNN